MGRLVLKFGGTSVADLSRIERVARIVAAAAEDADGVAVVVSAMAGDTNRLLGLAEEALRGPGASSAGPRPDDAPTSRAARAETDTIAACGEQLSAGLLALTLQRMGLRARSWLGWQMPMTTDGAYGAARIADLSAGALGPAIDSGEIAVIAGYQGVSPENRVATLGRGGSDTSAVAVAAALKAERCDIYTDVDGVFTTDPRVVPGARRLDRISYEEMLEMASLGAKVLQTRSVELAMAHAVPLRVLSSFEEPSRARQGTLVCDEGLILEKQIVSGVAFTRDEARVNLLALRDDPGVAAKIFSLMAERDINVDMIVQSTSRQANAANMVFTLPHKDLPDAREALESARETLGYQEMTSETGLSKVSIIGVGMKSHTGVAEKMFQALADKGINIDVISTSEIKISVLISAEYTELAVRALHAAYGLGEAADS